MFNLDEIRAGFQRNEFFLEYLPTVSLNSGRCVGAEALIRWRRDSTIIPPMDFIPTIENTLLSGMITYWVVDTVAVELGEWLREHPEAELSINVPPELLGRGGVLYAAEKSGFTEMTDQLIVEITERGVPDKIGVEALNECVGHGVKIALDDVCADDQNLVIVSRVHVDIVKLCKAFVDGINGDTRQDRVVKLTALLEGTDFTVIAEGVETAQQADVLAEVGVQMAQGWLYSRPLPVDKFKAYYDAHQ
jgi:sensor c-di-GMP phosphodiesterase-like protein